MPLIQQTADELIANQVAAIQGESSSFQEFTPGSILLAAVESNAYAVGLWLQAIIAQLLATTRAITSQGSDLDTWVGDFGITRLPASPASGLVTFSRFSNSAQALIPIGAQVQTANGVNTYAVIIDTTNVNYNAGQGGYIIAANTTSIDVPVECITSGSSGNASIGAISLLASAIPFVDTVTNAAALSNGFDAESDIALRSRFIAYINTLSRATRAAIAYAITSLGQNFTYSLTENKNYNGSDNLGYFYAVIDDGTHETPSDTLNLVASNIELYRGFAITYGVFAPVTTSANVVMVITTATGYIHSQVVAIVTAALTNYLNSFTLGQTLYYTRLEQVAYDSSPGVVNVTSVTLNAGTADLTVDNNHVIIAGSIICT
jgi:uncharacterized phage protein gp47/JayE